MAWIVVLHKHPKDPDAYTKHYREVHAPLAKRLPGVRRYEYSSGPVLTPTGESGYHLVALLEFDDMAAIWTALESPEGAEAIADAQVLAPQEGDMQVLLVDTIAA